MHVAKEIRYESATLFKLALDTFRRFIAFSESCYAISPVINPYLAGRPLSTRSRGNERGEGRGKKRDKTSQTEEREKEKKGKRDESSRGVGSSFHDKSSVFVLRDLTLHFSRREMRGGTRRLIHCASSAKTLSRVDQVKRESSTVKKKKKKKEEEKGTTMHFI